MNIYIPYTYLIGWSRLNWWYYGCEFANNRFKIAHPSNLWKTYFTSSKEVAIVRDIFGEPDVIQIRKTFYDADSCRLWETKILKRMKVVGDSKWLNKTDNIAIEGMPGNKNPIFGQKRPQYIIDAIKEARKKSKGINHPMWGKKNPNSGRKKGGIAWNKGLTKYTSDIVRLSEEKRYRSRYI